MSYLTPDPRWTIFSGVTDFESYLDRFVVKGSFHAQVPQDVIDGYIIAEHIMAQAWYHYPMMDEALVKVLRVLEMAVKMRCKKKGIELNYKDKKGSSKPKTLCALVDELQKSELSKPNLSTLHRFRYLRNLLMHPKENLLFGVLALNTIRQVLIQINDLFLQEYSPATSIIL